MPSTVLDLWVILALDKFVCEGCSYPSTMAEHVKNKKQRCFCVCGDTWLCGNGDAYSAAWRDCVRERWMDGEDWKHCSM